MEQIAKTRQSPLPGYLIRLFLALLYLSAAAPKLQDPTAFAQSVAAYGILPSRWITLAALWLPCLELLAAFALLLGCCTRAAAALIAGLSLTFAGAIFQATQKGLDISCGCFGVDLKVNYSHLLLNLACLAGAGYLVWRGPGPLSLDAKQQLESWRSWGKKCGIALTVCALAVVAELGVAGGSGGESGGQLAFDTPAIEIGTLGQGETREMTVTYFNRGSGTLVIERWEVTCGCTVPKMSKFVLAPGESGEMKVAYTAGTAPGPFEKAIKISHDGSPEPEILKVRGFTEQIVEFEPASLTLRPGETRTVKMTCKSRDFKILGVQTSAGSLKVRAQRGSDPRSWLLEIEALGPIPPPTTGTNHALSVMTDLARTGFVLPVLGASDG